MTEQAARGLPRHWWMLAIIVGVVFLALLAFGVLARFGSGGGTPTGADAYVDEYGGSRAVYADIIADTSCASLQGSFDLAAANNDRAEPGTAEHRWTTGYMVAADERMRDIGCY